MNGKLIYLVDKDEYIFITTINLNKEIKIAMETDMSQRLNAKVAVISGCGTFEYISKKEMVPKIEGVALPARPGFSESFIADLDKALNDYHRKQEQSSQRTSTPHVRIEFDDINDVPCVWVDGKRIDRSDTGLVSASLDWHTKDPAATDDVIRAYKIEYLKGDHREGIAQGSPTGPDLFKNDAHAK